MDRWLTMKALTNQEGQFVGILHEKGWEIQLLVHNYYTIITVSTILTWQGAGTLIVPGQL